MLDGLTRHWIFLNLIENNQRLSLVQLDTSDILQKDKECVSFIQILIKNFLHRFTDVREVHKNI